MDSSNTVEIRLDQVQLSSAPGYIPSAAVGSIEWLTAWFPVIPVRDGNLIVVFGDHFSEHVSISFPAHFLKSNFAFFENAEDIAFLPEWNGADFGHIIAFLMVGAFPKLPYTTVEQTSMHLTNCIDALRLTHNLQMKNSKNFADFIELEVRQLLSTSRVALLETHIDKVCSMDSPAIVRPLRSIFAAAGVRPFLCAGMKNMKEIEICGSSAARYFNMAVNDFANMLHHYDDLLTRSKFYLDQVVTEIREVIARSKRVNKIPTASSAKQMMSLPSYMDLVIYEDPLTKPLGLPSHFTI